MTEGGDHSVEAVLLDVDGVLVVSWQPLPGAAETLRSLPADERRQLRRQAATLVRERFGLDDIADAYEELLYEGVAQPRRRELHRPTLWSK